MLDSVVIPELAYPDLGDAVAWLCSVLGCTERLRIGNHRAQLVFPGGGSLVATQGAPDSNAGLESYTCHRVMVRVSDVAAHHAHALKHRAKILSSPTDYPYGERQYSLEDPAGHRWVFSQSIADVDPAAWGGELRHSRAQNDSSRLAEFARRYTAAWCSHTASSVAAFYSESGSLTINDGPPAVGREAVEGAAQSFMTAYPDLVVKFDRLEPEGDRVLYHWRFIGTNTGPGGTGKQVKISGYEDWKIGSDGLIADSKGHYDAQDWDRQLSRR